MPRVPNKPSAYSSYAQIVLVKARNQLLQQIEEDENYFKVQVEQARQELR